MRKLILSLALLLSQNLFGQISIRNMSLSNPDSAVIYVGVPNLIQIKGTDKAVTLVAVRSEILDTPGLNVFSVRPYSGNNSETFKVYLNKKLLITKVFQINPTPEPSPQLGNLAKTIASTQEIIANGGLKVAFQNSNYRGDFFVQSFVIHVLSPAGATLFSSVESDRGLFSSAQTDIIKSLKSGSKIIFDDILIITPSSQVRRLRDFFILVN